MKPWASSASRGMWPRPRYTWYAARPNGKSDTGNSYARLQDNDRKTPGGNLARVLPSCEEKKRRMCELDNSRDARTMRAIQQAAYDIGADLPMDISWKLREAVLNNCRDGRRWRYELLDVPTISRAEFYRRKREFLRDVAQRCGIW